jgi:hypothetical protein
MRPVLAADQGVCLFEASEIRTTLLRHPLE